MNKKKRADAECASALSNGAVKNTNSTYYQGELPKYLTLLHIILSFCHSSFLFQTV